MLYPKPDWTCICPALSSTAIQHTMGILEAWGLGTLPSSASLSFPLMGMRGPVPLEQLMAVPMRAWKNMAGLILGKAKNACVLGYGSASGLPPYCLELVGKAERAYPLCSFRLLGSCMVSCM